MISVTTYIIYNVRCVVGYILRVAVIKGDVKMEVVQIVAIVLAAVGALNWGLVGLFKFDLVATVAGGMKFGNVNTFSRVVYVLVAVAGLVGLTAIRELV